MTAATMTLTDFLLARIAEDEAEARRGVGWADRSSRWGRVLAECEAKRRILESRPAIDAPGPMLEVVHAEVQRQREYVWQLLTLPYADHPDYRDKWRP